MAIYAILVAFDFHVFDSTDSVGGIESEVSLDMFDGDPKQTNVPNIFLDASLSGGDYSAMFFDDFFTSVLNGGNQFFLS